MITIPTIEELQDSIRTDIESQFNIIIPLIGKNFLRIMAIVHAAKLKLFYLQLAMVQKNIWPDTADSESIGGTLERFGRIKLGRNPFPAVSGQYEVIVKGSIGALISASTTFKSDDTSTSPGFLFILDEDYTLVSVTDTIILRALTAGVESKLMAGDTLTVTSPIALVDKSAKVYAEIVQPLSAETETAYRIATLNAFRFEAQGGAGTDYRLWSADAQGVKTVYPYARSGFPCEINLFVEANIADSIDGKGTPSASILDDVEAVVEFNPDTTILPFNERGRRPLQVIVNFLPVQIIKVDVTIVDFVGLDTDIEDLLNTAITDMINKIRPFVASCDLLADKNDILDRNRVISAIISQLPGSIFSDIILEFDDVELMSYVFTGGNIPDVNSISYV